MRVESLHDASECLKVREPSFDFPAKWLCLQSVLHEIEAKQSSWFELRTRLRAILLVDFYLEIGIESTVFLDPDGLSLNVLHLLILFL